MVITLGGAAAGQALLNVADPSGTTLFILVSALVSLALVPMLLSTGRTPPFEAPRPVGLRHLYRVSPTGVVGYFGMMMANGAYFGMAAVYGRAIGLSIRDVSILVGLIMLGGMVSQWPLGRLSDSFDRRKVLTGVTFLAALCAVSASAFAGSSLPGLFAFTALFGGMSLPLYSLCVAYINDYLEPDQMVQASGTLVLSGGVGAVLGPVSAALAMQSFGPNGFFWWLATIHAAIGLFALYRMTHRRAIPSAEQSPYIAQSPPQTSVAATLCARGRPGAEEPNSADAAAVSATRAASPVVSTWVSQAGVSRDPARGSDERARPDVLDTIVQVGAAGARRTGSSAANSHPGSAQAAKGFVKRRAFSLGRGARDPDHVDQGAERSRNLPVAGIVEKHSLEAWRPVAEHADQLAGPEERLGEGFDRVGDRRARRRRHECRSAGH